MDIASDPAGSVYWIEEVEDQNNNILKMERNSRTTEIIESGLSIPYNLKYDHGLFWNEIYVASDGMSVGEFTKITKYTGSSNIVVGNFKKTSPISTRQDTTHYGPYLIVGDYLFFSNNTSMDYDGGGFSTIQMVNTITEKKYGIQNIRYKAEFMRADNDSLYVVGSNQDGFLIEKLALPVSVPEFSGLAVIVLAACVMVLVVISFRKGSLLSGQQFPVNSV